MLDETTFEKVCLTRQKLLNSAHAGVNQPTSGSLIKRRNCYLVSLTWADVRVWPTPARPLVSLWTPGCACPPALFAVSPSREEPSSETRIQTQMSPAERNGAAAHVPLGAKKYIQTNFRTTLPQKVRLTWWREKKLNKTAPTCRTLEFSALFFQGVHPHRQSALRALQWPDKVSCEGKRPKLKYYFYLIIL